MAYGINFIRNELILFPINMSYLKKYHSDKTMLNLFLYSIYFHELIN